MIKNILKIVLLLLIAGCSAKVSKENSSAENQKEIKSKQAEKLALSHFVDGTMNEMKGNYAEAILDFQEALQYDSSAGVFFALGKNYFRLNKLALAKKYAEKAVELDSTNKDYYFLLADIYSFSRNFDEAEKIYEHIIQLDSTDIQAHYNLGRLYQANKPLKALEVYKNLLKITGPEWNVLLKIAELNERLGKINETIKTVEELLKLNPSDLNLQKILIDAYNKHGDFDKSFAMLEDALRLFPDDLRLIELKANALVYSGRWKEAADEYRKLIVEPEMPFASKVRIGGLFIAQAMKDSAVIPVAKELLQVIDQDSSDWQIKAYLGEIAIQQNDDSSAVKYFREASRLAQWNAEVWVRLGGLLFDQAKYEEAAEELQKVAKNFPHHFGINLILGLSLAQTGKHKQALPFLERAVKLQSDDLNANLAIAFTYNQLKESDKAIKHLNKVLSVDPENVQALGTLGLIYDSQKKYAECDSVYRKALEIDSSNTLIQNNYAYSLAERGIKLDEALKLAKSAVSKEPYNSSYLDTIGWIYFKLGDYEKAEKYVKKALELDENNATLLDHLGDIYEKMNNKDKAVEMWKAAYELDSTKTEIKNKIEGDKI